MKKKVVFLGCYAGSNQQGQAYKRGYFYLDFDDSQKNNSFGYRSTSFFIDDETFKQLSSISPLSNVELDVRQLGNQDVVFNVSVIK